MSGLGQPDRSRQELLASAHWLTPTELARELGKERREVIQLCLDLGVPIVNGRISRETMVAALEAELRGESGG